METRVWGTKSPLSKFELDKGAVVPNHSHPHEQSGDLVSGKIRVIIKGEHCVAKPGDGWNPERGEDYMP